LGRNSDSVENRAIQKACLLYITILGIPFGKQYFKLAKLSLTPFGAQVVAAKDLK